MSGAHPAPPGPPAPASHRHEDGSVCHFDMSTMRWWSREDAWPHRAVPCPAPPLIQPEPAAHDDQAARLAEGWLPSDHPLSMLLWKHSRLATDSRLTRLSGGTTWVGDPCRCSCGWEARDANPGWHRLHLADAILASDWLAEHDAQVIDRHLAEVERRLHERGSAVYACSADTERPQIAASYGDATAVVAAYRAEAAGGAR